LLYSKQNNNDAVDERGASPMSRDGAEGGKDVGTSSKSNSMPNISNTLAVERRPSLPIPGRQPTQHVSCFQFPPTGARRN